MRVFVTGATGFVGSAVARQLRADGHRVYGLARTSDAEQQLSHNGIHAVRGDLDTRLPDALTAARSADATVFAAQVPPEREGLVVSAFLTALKSGTPGALYHGVAGEIFKPVDRRSGRSRPRLFHSQHHDGRGGHSLGRVRRTHHGCQQPQSQSAHPARIELDANT